MNSSNLHTFPTINTFLFNPNTTLFEYLSFGIRYSFKSLYLRSCCTKESSHAVIRSFVPSLHAIHAHSCDSSSSLHLTQFAISIVKLMLSFQINHCKILFFILLPWKNMSLLTPFKNLFITTLLSFYKNGGCERDSNTFQFIVLFEIKIVKTLIWKYLNQTLIFY